MNSQKIESTTQLVIALDFPNAERAKEMVNLLKGYPVVLKVGLELFCAEGPDFVRELVNNGYQVFLDLKFHDIPTTVAKAARQALELKTAFFTYHLAGGPEMCRAVHREIDAWAAEQDSTPSNALTIPLGVTVLTSHSSSSWAETTKTLAGVASTPETSVQGFLDQSLSWGVRGMVCSPHEVGRIRKARPDIFTMVPGIRPESSDKQDQARSMTPSEAALAGAHAIVVGRPITQASQPIQVVESILEDLKGVYRGWN